jgi:NADH-quinone oxidoreductase subunit G
MAQPAKMATITIDEVEYQFEEGTNLFEAVERATGEKLPHFCYHPGLSIAGVCRMCQVEVEGSPKLMIACNTTVRDGMVIRTKTPRVQETVRNILNFHLLHHPVDCPVCDQAGECSLQDFYMDHGLYEAEIDHEDKLAKGKVKPIGDLVMLDAERCVLCARCTRFTSEVTKTYELGIFNRGNHSEIDVAPGKSLDNNYSLNTVDICPVGALTSRDFRFRRRVWWLSETDSICPGCATGCNMQIHHSEGIPYRFKPRENLAVNQYWMCDHGRLLYHQIRAKDRLSEPAQLEDGARQSVSWERAYARIASALGSAEQRSPLLIVGSPHLSVEELYALRSLAQAAQAELLGSRLSGSEMEEDDGILLAGDRTPQRRGRAEARAGGVLARGARGQDRCPNRPADLRERSGRPGSRGAAPAGTLRRSRRRGLPRQPHDPRGGTGAAGEHLCRERRHFRQSPRARAALREGLRSSGSGT